MPRFHNSALAGYVVAVVVVLALAITSWDFTQRTRDAQAFVSHTHEVLANVAAAEAALWRAEAAQRAFLVTTAKPFLEEREQALELVRRHVGMLEVLTADNPVQQRRIAELRPLLQQRIAVFQHTEDLAEFGGTLDRPQRLEAGLEVIARIRPVFTALVSEEHRLLALREVAERDRLQEARRVFALMVLAILASVPLVGWQLRRELQARTRAEAEAAQERRYSELHARALMLYISAQDQGTAVDGTLELLAAQPMFRAAALFTRTHGWQVLASRGMPPDVAAVTLGEEGPAGVAAREARLVSVAADDPALAPVADWLARQGQGLLLCPVVCRARTLGLLALVPAEPMSQRERDFVEQLGAQWGIALFNLRQYRELGELAARLREQGHELRQANEALKAADRSKSEFLANMSHELRTPLNAVIGFAEVLGDGLLGDLSDEQREVVGEISTSGKHLLALINEVLDIAKIEAGQMQLELEPLRPAELATSGMSMLRERALRQGVQLHTEVAPELDMLLADPRKARQIVFNLLSNAVKFTPAGGLVRLRLWRVPRERLAQAQADEHTRVIAPVPLDHEQYLEIAVSDSGIGIAPENLPQLFQPFMQIDSALGRQYAGTGLGLSMVLSLSQLHGGGLQVHSRPQEGSTFTVWLPWRPVGPETATQPPAAQGPPSV
ncbi:sensor histidine kinase [Azohydromonas caseinilytica]|uniref:histidine kinase n=1 Tax=Azohydromonas caseinilytica TaxID=2728836 RepID=A0A848FB28_9BURK|nr:ATP-binding protein [Azohydromonas caseinilytica]NML16498.1 hypothetical protein [Azohydromonas caseinilytica]